MIADILKNPVGSVVADFIKVIQVGSDASPATTTAIEQVRKIADAGDEIPSKINCGGIPGTNGGNVTFPVKDFGVNCLPKPGVFLVRLGSDNRPTSRADIEEIQSLLSEGCNDEDLTIVTHHNFELEWASLLEEPDCPFIVTTHKKGRI